MKYALKSLALAAVLTVLSVTAALAGGQELAYFKLQNLDTLSGTSIASGDFIPVYDATTGKVMKVDATQFSPAQVSRTATDAVANGQTSKAVTVTGITAASRCVATSNEVSTNAVYIRAVVPTANTATVTVSGDPGTSGMDLTVICIN